MKMGETKVVVEWNASELSAWARLHLPSVVCEALEANEVDGSTFLVGTGTNVPANANARVTCTDKQSSPKRRTTQ